MYKFLLQNVKDLVHKNKKYIHLQIHLRIITHSFGKFTIWQTSFRKKTVWHRPTLNWFTPTYVWVPGVTAKPWNHIRGTSFWPWRWIWNINCNVLRPTFNFFYFKSKTISINFNTEFRILILNMWKCIRERRLIWCPWTNHVATILKL